MYDVLEVRNALVKSVYGATEYTIFGHHHCLLSTFISYHLLQLLQGSEWRGCVSSLPPVVGYLQVIRHWVRRECGSKAWAKQQSKCWQSGHHYTQTPRAADAQNEPTQNCSCSCHSHWLAPGL